MVGYVTKQRETRDQRGGLCLDEDECNYYFRQLIWAVQFCHENHVAHRCVWCGRGGKSWLDGWGQP
jgi:serine/threonine protein kinase